MTFIFVFEKKSKFIFVCSPLWSILICKIPQFWSKATVLDNPSYISRKHTPWGSLKLALFLFFRREPKKEGTSSWTKAKQLSRDSSVLFALRKLLTKAFGDKKHFNYGKETCIVELNYWQIAGIKTKKFLLNGQF